MSGVPLCALRDVLIQLEAAEFLAVGAVLVDGDDPRVLLVVLQRIPVCLVGVESVCVRIEQLCAAHHGVALGLRACGDGDGLGILQSIFGDRAVGDALFVDLLFARIGLLPAEDGAPRLLALQGDRGCGLAVIDGELALLRDVIDVRSVRGDRPVQYDAEIHDVRDCAVCDGELAEMRLLVVVVVDDAIDAILRHDGIALVEVEIVEVVVGVLVFVERERLVAEFYLGDGLFRQ